jgi:hypothetical protein
MTSTIVIKENERMLVGHVPHGLQLTRQRPLPFHDGSACANLEHNRRVPRKACYIILHGVSQRGIHVSL